MKIKKQIYKCARKARKWLEKFLKEEMKDSIYKELDTAGWCAVGTAKLYEVLTANEQLVRYRIDPTLVDLDGGGCHAFLIVSLEKDDLIVDITADQFGMKPIEIRSSRKTEEDFWGDDKFAFGIEAFKKEVKKWGEESPQKHGLIVH